MGSPANILVERLLAGLPEEARCYALPGSPKISRTSFRRRLFFFDNFRQGDALTPHTEQP